jgi:hypothetical protein
MCRIEQGEKSISIYDVTNKRALLFEVGIAFEGLVQRN